MRVSALAQISGSMQITAIHGSAVRIQAVATFLFLKVCFSTVFWKLGLGLGLDLQLHYFSIFRGE